MKILFPILALLLLSLNLFSQNISYRSVDMQYAEKINDKWTGFTDMKDDQNILVILDTLNKKFKVNMGGWPIEETLTNKEYSKEDGYNCYGFVTYSGEGIKGYLRMCYSTNLNVKSHELTMFLPKIVLRIFMKPEK